MLSRLRPGGVPGGPPPVGARRASTAGSEEPEAATDVGRRRDAPRPVPRVSEGRKWRGAVDTLPERARITDAPPGENGPGEGEGDTGDTAPGPKRPKGRANSLRWARRGPPALVNGGLKKVRDPWNSTAAEKSRCSGLESEGTANDPLTYPFKNSHQDLLDGLAKKPLTAALVKLEQSGVLVNDAGEVSFWQRDVLFPICNRCSIMQGLQ